MLAYNYPYSAWDRRIPILHISGTFNITASGTPLRVRVDWLFY